MRKFKIEMLCPERIFFEGEIESLTLETHEGRVGILAGHTPMVIGLKPGAAALKDEKGEKIAVCGDGIVEVLSDKVVILCQTMEWPEDLDIDIVKKDIEEWENKIKQTTEKYMRYWGEQVLARHYARLKILEKKK